MDIEKFARRKGMDLKSLAEMLGLKYSAVYNYKRGRAKPSYEVLEKLFSEGATIEELFSKEIETIVLSNSQVSPQGPLNEAEIVRKGLLELAKQMKG